MKSETKCNILKLYLLCCQIWHTVRVCIVIGLMFKSICPAVTVTLRFDKNAGFIMLDEESVTHCAAVTTIDKLTSVPPHKYVCDLEKIFNKT